jgi:hypothetical protein
MFLHFNGQIYNVDQIKFVDCTRFTTTGEITVHLAFRSEIVKSQEAINVIMELCPSVLEGKQAKYERHAWAIHNLIGHPLMQVFAWLHLPHLGIKIHDATVPAPKKVE